MKTYHALAVECDEHGTYDTHDCGLVATEDEAVKAVRAAGHTVIEEGNGGAYSLYDADDAPRIFLYLPDGHGAIGITVEIPR